MSLIPMALSVAISGIIFGMGSANERRRYIVTSSLIGWAHTNNDPGLSICSGYWKQNRPHSQIPQRNSYIIFQNRNNNISVLNGALGDMGQVHCVICDIGL